MSLTVTQTLTAVGRGITSSFGVTGGTAPYTWSVLPGGAGGTINSSSGLYTAPAAVPSNPSQLFDTIQVVDSAGTPAKAQAKMFIGDPLLLFCEIIQNQMGLPQGRVYLFDQKIMQPTDVGIYVAVSVQSVKVFGNDNSHVGAADPGGLTSNQSLNCAATLQLDIISRDNSALFQKEAVLLALNSDYSEQQQNANSFFIGKIPPAAQFTNLSAQDGAAIPYRFVISIVMQYFYTKTQAVGYMVPVPPPTVNYAQS